MRRVALFFLASLLLAATPASDPPQISLIAHRTEPLPRNTHVFVRERWRSLIPPTSRFSLHKKGSAEEVAFDDRTQPLENGRLHELVPTTDLAAKSTYELTVNDAQTFEINISDTIDREPPAWDASLRSAHDQGKLGPIYLVWRSGSDGLVDLDELPSEVLMSLGDLGAEGYVAVQVIDFAGHRLETREIALGPVTENASLRSVRLAVKRSAKLVRENWPITAVAFAVMALTVYAIAKRKRHFA